ncbi:MAG: hypothetical protein JXA82_19080, partial [Sedimentisphaerales bacterium]|nr:hypothetical protein [Sedimentisphaerales bacterium]
SKVVVTPEQPVQLFPLRDVRLLESPFSEAIIAETSEITVDFSYIGIQDKAKVRDLWTRMDLGEFSDSFEQEIPLHGAGLFRISPTP